MLKIHCVLLHQIVDLHPWQCQSFLSDSGRSVALCPDSDISSRPCPMGYGRQFRTGVHCVPMHTMVGFGGIDLHLK